MARKIIDKPTVTKSPLGIMTSTCGYIVERVTRIELALSAWEADVLPLNYTRGLDGRSGHGAFATTSYRNL
jgi:hypothetical protein